MTEQLTKSPELQGKPNWAELIEHALTVPGSMGNTYNRFYDYSFFNQVLLYLQGVREPVATYKRWQSLGRQVQKGSKAKTIMRPMIKKTAKDDGTEESRLLGFKYVNCLFTLSETEGDDLPPPEVRDWEPSLAMRTLDIEEVPFQSLDGNTAGYSIDRKLAINPVAPYPMKTLCHEMAHIVLGHTKPENHQEYLQHRGVHEFQAEATAYLLMNELDCLEFMDAAESRAYIQLWLRQQRPDDADIRKVFGATEKILKAGRPERSDK